MATAVRSPMPLAVVSSSTVVTSPLRTREVLPAALAATAGALAATAGASQLLPVGPRVQPVGFPGGARGPALASLAVATSPAGQPGYWQTTQGSLLGQRGRSVTESRASPPRSLTATGSQERTVGSLPASGSLGIQRTTWSTAPPAALSSLCIDEKLNAELRESLAEEAALEAAVAKKRSLALLQASRMETLQRSTAELLRRREVEAELTADASEEGSDSCDRTPTPPRGDGDEEESAEEEGGWAARAAVNDVWDDGDGSGALSLEAATAQLGCLRELRRQVACLEEDLQARTAEVERLSAEIGSVELQEQQMMGTAQATMAYNGAQRKVAAHAMPG